MDWIGGIFTGQETIGFTAKYRVFLIFFYHRPILGFKVNNFLARLSNEVRKGETNAAVGIIKLYLYLSLSLSLFLSKSLVVRSEKARKIISIHTRSSPFYMYSIYINVYTYIHTYICIYMYICMCV